MLAELRPLGQANRAQRLYDQQMSHVLEVLQAVKCSGRLRARVSVQSVYAGSIMGADGVEAVRGMLLRARTWRTSSSLRVHHKRCKCYLPWT